MLERLNPAQSMDEKIDALEKQISSKPEPGKKSLHYKKLF